MLRCLQAWTEPQILTTGMPPALLCWLALAHNAARDLSLHQGIRPLVSNLRYFGPPLPLQPFRLAILTQRASQLPMRDEDIKRFLRVRRGASASASSSFEPASAQPPSSAPPIVVQPTAASLRLQAGPCPRNLQLDSPLATVSSYPLTALILHAKPASVYNVQVSSGGAARLRPDEKGFGKEAQRDLEGATVRIPSLFSVGPQ